MDVAAQIKTVPRRRPPGQLHGRRLPCQIMHELLILAEQGEGKTRLMYGANLSYALLVRYLGFLERKGFLVPAEGKGYAVTPEGRVFMADLAQLLRHFGDDEKEALF